MRIASLHAHPDDAEILAGGTLALLRSLGHEVTIVSLTAGDCGSATETPEEISAIRKREAAAAAELIGAHYRCGGFYDLAIFNDDPSRRTVTRLLRELRPEIVLAASPSDYLCDHEAASALVRDGCFAASAPNYRTGGTAAPLPAIPALYFVDPVDGCDREGQPVTPQFVVDVTSVFDTKRRMLACHESQRAWLKQQHGIDDYLDEMSRWSQARGAFGGARFGEGFRQYRVHPYPTEPALQTLLGAFVAGPREEPPGAAD